ncbi:uncharacterized protein EV422DRAFT_529276 [Fimicolochytrium jonesii]|uniref:uncharacterized protein n=1 Tax=Fimicolochytrium jonesii TaxID=1396493 RepID=UPI0022FF15D6|nr:uncharacterized protein EV422DRAFT_529276 [Fimicolochytrium jonesii]KAI8821131.1 hypothetical protein EV422DRAFT_529276 [Fimicolochytrium jonesii]
MSTTAGRYPTPAMASRAMRLKDLIARAESTPSSPGASHSILRAANGVLEDVDSSTQTVTGLARNAPKAVDDRLVRALKSSFRDAVGKADAAVRREWVKLADALVDEVRFVFEAEGAEDPTVNSDERAEQCRQNLHELAGSIDLVGEFDAVVLNFIDSRFRTGARDLYSAMLDSANTAVEQSLATRVQRVSQKLEAIAEPAQPPAVESRPQQAAAAQPRPPSVASEAFVPAAVPRPVADSGPRPASEVVHPSQPPQVPLSTKPRPKSMAVNHGAVTTGPSPPSRPPAIERSPVAKSRTSVSDEATDGSDSIEEEPVARQGAADAPQSGKPGGLAANLNRMLSGPPPKFARPPVQRAPEEEERVNDENEPTPDIPPRPPARIGVTDEPHDGAEYDHDVQPAAAPASVQAPPAAVQTPISTPRESHDGPTAEDVASQHLTPGGNAAAGKASEKLKAQKSPKMGLRGMLSHLTKSRPKKAKSSSKDDGQDDADAVEEPEPVSQHVEERAEPVAPAPVVPQRPPSQVNPQPRPEEVAHPEEFKHSRTGSMAESNASGYDSQGTEGSEAPSKPRRPPQNAAMSALANVMRGPAKDDAASDADETASIRSRQRQSVYSEPEGPISAEHPQQPPPRPARPMSTIYNNERRNTVHEDEGTSPSSDGSAPRRPPKPVQSPAHRMSGVYPTPVPAPAPSPSEGAGSPPVHSPSAPVIPPKPRRSSHIDDTASESSQHSAAASHPVPIPTPRPRPVPSVRPASQISTSTAGGNERPQSQYSERPQSHYSERPPSHYGSPSHAAAQTPINERPQSTYSVDSPSPPSHAGEQTIPEDSAPAPPVESPKPRRIPGMFGTNHGALGALAAAVTGRQGGGFGRSASQDQIGDDGGVVGQHPLSRGHSREASGGEEGGAEALHAEVEAQEELPVGSPPMRRATGAPLRSNPDLFNGTTLNLKRKEASTSGDDRAIEKGGLDWLNKHLHSHNIQVDNLYTSLGDGLNLIYALEDATGESVGKYNKRAMLPVLKIDNIAVALNFVAKKGIAPGGFCTPQDIMDGDKGKILTLFNYILKAFPAS